MTNKVACKSHANLQGGTGFDQYQPWCASCRAASARAEAFASTKREIEAEMAEALVEELPDVWCAKCNKPAATTITLTLGETRAYCDEHAWLLRAPSGV